MVDRSGEVARLQLNTADMVVIDTLPAAVTDLVTALGTIADGTIIGVIASGSNKLTNAAHSAEGQREERWLITYEDTVTKALYTSEIPCRKSSVKPPTETDKVDITQAPWTDFVTKFEALARSADGNAINVLRIQLSGRNL